MLAVGLALCSAVLFGALSVALALAMRRDPDAEVGALVTGIVALAVCAPFLLARWDWNGDVLPFLLAGLLAPGGSQVLYVRAVREAGPSRAAVIVGAAPLVSVTIALVALGEPVRPALIAGAVLIVAGGLALAGERGRPAGFRAIGLALGLGAAAFFATRDNVVRKLAEDSSVSPELAAAATILSGSALIAVYLVATRGARLPRQLSRALVPFAPSGLLWGLSYVSLFEAFYRSRVSVVSPLVASESLFGVLAAWLLFRRHEHVGRRVLLGAVLVVGGGTLIGAFR